MDDQALRENLEFPFEGRFKPTPQKKEAISIEYFLELLEAEEEYYQSEIGNTRLMITRLRKIFYDKGGWNKELIRSAADIVDRYGEELYEDPNDPPYKVRILGLKMPSFIPWHFYVVHKARKTVVQEGDRSGLAPGTVPEIYANDNQEITLADKLYSDIGHTLCGLDAINHSAVVTPFPSWLAWAYPVLPYIKSNADAVTWVGDIASIAGEYLFATSHCNAPLDDEAKKQIIDVYAPYSDMLGNIDPYVIAQAYNIGTESGDRPSEIFKDFYLDIGIKGKPPIGREFREHRYTYFANAIGLVNWNGHSFKNEQQWRRNYEKQLRDATIFYCLSRSSGLGRLFQAMLTWMGCTGKTIDIKKLTDLFFESLKFYLSKEPKAKELSAKGI